MSGIKISRKIVFAVLLGMIISFCYAAGYQVEAFDSLDLKDGGFYLKWLGLTVFSAGVLYVLWEIMDKYGDGYENKCGNRNILSGVRFPIPHWGCVLILFLCWVPAWLSLFPGAFAYDALSEWEQVRDGMITAHHPVIHVLLLGGLVEGVHSLTGSYNTGIAVYTFLQMFLLANVLACTIRFLKEFQVPDLFRWIALLFYGLSPVMQLFAVSATKDVLFTAAQLLFLLYLIRFYCRKEEFFRSRRQLIFFGVIAFFTMILRNNGFYIVVITLAVMAFGCGKYRKKFAAVLLAVGLAYGIYAGPFYSALHVTPGGIEEMLSVPLQQMARVYKYDYDSLEQQDLELLYEIIPKENLDSYRATVSDFVKKGFQREAFEEHKAEFFQLWCRWGAEHPLTYVNSFLINTVDFWYPNAVVDGYRDVYGKSSYFDYRVDEPGEEVILLPGVHEYYERISFDKNAQKAPFAFLILSPGWYLVMTMVIFGYLWRCRKYEFMVPGFMFVLSILTVLLGPMALVRYVLILYYAFPVLLPVFICSRKFTEGSRDVSVPPT